ncbi:MAG: ABC transporter substrate-binding protein [Alphaproteobacteria bacterium]|nr:ABC transporter substrate-binding protein [Alphaproteobacteria bacterium]
MMQRRSLLTLPVAALAAPAAWAQPARQNLRFAVDWVIQVNHSWAVLAARRGYFQQEGINATVERGFGSGQTIQQVAAGALPLGFADIPTAIQFAMRNPQVGLRVVGVIFDGSPLVLTVDANGPIRSARDVEGRRIAAPEADAGRQMFPAFARAAGADLSRVEWVNVTGQLREAMLVRGEVHGITGFITSTIMGLESIGMPAARQRHFRYREAGLPFFSGGLITTQRFAAENPALLRGAVRALMRGTQHMARDPNDAIAAVREQEPLTDPAVERRRWEVVRDEMLVTENVRANGLSFVDPARMQRNIDIVRDTFGLTQPFTPADIWDGSFLPPAAELALPPTT